MASQWLFAPSRLVSSLIAQNTLWWSYLRSVVMFQVWFGSVTLIHGEFRSYKIITVFVHYVLQKRDKRMTVVSICSACQNAPVGIRIDQLQLLLDFKVTWREVKISTKPFGSVCFLKQLYYLMRIGQRNAIAFELLLQRSLFKSYLRKTICPFKAIDLISKVS